MFSKELVNGLLLGKSKGIALVKFKSVNEAIFFLESNPSIEFDEVLSWFEFGFEHSENDWTCKSCQNINFHTRQICFKCSLPMKTDNSEPVNDGIDDISINPTRFLLIRNLDENLNAQNVNFDLLIQLIIFRSSRKYLFLNAI